MTRPEAGEARAGGLLSAVGHRRRRGDWAVGAECLGQLDGRTWLSVDDASRRVTYTSAAPVSGVKGWLSADVAEPSGFVAAVTSWHVDGRFRERATRILGEAAGGLRSAALTVRLFDHVPQVRDAAIAGLAEHLAPEQAEAALSVALAGRNRRHGAAVLEAVSASCAHASCSSRLSTRCWPVMTPGCADGLTRRLTRTRC